MANLNIRVLGLCSAGGNHLDVRLQLNGTNRVRVTLDADDVTSAPTDEELEAATKVLIRAYAIGKTRAEIKTGLQAGIDVIV